MDSESTDSGRDHNRSVGGGMRVQDIFDDLDGGSAQGWGSAWGGLHAGRSGLSQAIGASTQVSINSRTSYCVPSVIVGCTVTLTGNYFDNPN